MVSRMFDAVIFDMDGVLCDSEPFIAAASAEMLRRRYGISVTRDDFRPFVGTGEDRYLSGAASLHGVTVDLAIDKPLTDEIYLEIIEGALQPTEGVRELIADARAAGLRLELATSSARPKLDGNLAAIGIPESSFDVLVSAEHVPQEARPGDLHPSGRGPASGGVALPRGRRRPEWCEGGARRGVRGPRDHVVAARSRAPGRGGVRHGT
jgi:beta-phosphoglucomutase-like phosphatase (HAD superfamily)